MIIASGIGARVAIRNKLTGTANVDLYSVSDRQIRSYIKSISICNITGADETIDLWINDGTSDFYILKGFTVLGNTAVDYPLDIFNGDTLRAKASAGNVFDITGTIIEQTQASYSQRTL